MKKLLFALLGAGFLLSGCDGPTDADIQRQLEEQRLKEEQQSTVPVETTGEMEVVAVEIQNFAFSPDTLTVKPGQSITVINRDVAGHSMTSDDGSSFNTGIIGKDESMTIAAPSAPGTYAYHCTPHPSMKGTLVVVE